MTKTQIEADAKHKGLWDVFKRRREELKGKGVDPREAWEQAAREIVYNPEYVPALGRADDDVAENPPETPPGESAGSPGGEDEIPQEMIDRALKDPVDMRETIQFVFQTLAVPNLKPKDAPSLAAWEMWNWARNRGGQGEFYRSYVPKLLPTKIDDAATAMKDDGRKQIDLADKLLAEVKSERLGFHPHEEKPK